MGRCKINDKELHTKVNAAAYALMKEKGVVSASEVFMAMGILSKADYENWRRGNVDYLERVCKINLRKLSKINSEIRAFAKRNNLKPSFTFYKKWGKNKASAKLRFSKSGDARVEELYATHYISNRTIEENKARQESAPVTET